MAFVPKTIAEIEAFTLAEKKAWLEDGGQPVKPEGYDALAADDIVKIAYDESIARNTAQIAGIADHIANGT
jgi:hypothetical protein